MKNNLNFPMEVKSLGNTGLFSGYASIFGFIDNHMDLVVPGAFERTLVETNNGRDIKLLWQHDATQPIGTFDIIREDDTGLYVEGSLQLDVQQGREAYNLLKSGALKGLSIGYNVAESSIDADTGVRFISDLDLFEISLVTFPANELAQVEEVKAMTNYDQMEIIQLSDALDKSITLMHIV